MSTTAVGGVGGAASDVASAGRSSRGITSLRSEDFFKILVTELQHQDPLAPSKTADMISQVSQIRSIENSAQLETTLDSLVRNQRSAGASDLIGKFVTATSTDENGTTQSFEGVVTGVRLTADGPAVLELDTGATVPISQVQQVMTPEEADRRLAANASAARPATATAKALLPAAPRHGGLLSRLADALRL
ncbi:MAG: flagellar hook capping FlgD N-terminal domain-containing protein [Phycisphaerae bacterium]